MFHHEHRAQNEGPAQIATRSIRCWPPEPRKCGCKIPPLPTTRVHRSASDSPALMNIAALRLWGFTRQSHCYKHPSSARRHLTPTDVQSVLHPGGCGRERLPWGWTGGLPVGLQRGLPWLDGLLSSDTRLTFVFLYATVGIVTWVSVISHMWGMPMGIHASHGGMHSKVWGRDRPIQPTPNRRQPKLPLSYMRRLIHVCVCFSQ